MKAYAVRYKMYSADEEKVVSLLAKNKFDAYDRATYELIPKVEGQVPYSSWVNSVTYNNGKVHYFNTIEGLAY